MDLVPQTNPFEGLDKGDVQLALASEFVRKLRELLSSERKEAASALLALATATANRTCTLDYSSARVSEIGAHVLALDGLEQLFKQGDAYARS